MFGKGKKQINKMAGFYVEGYLEDEDENANSSLSGVFPNNGPQGDHTLANFYNLSNALQKAFKSKDTLENALNPAVPLRFIESGRFKKSFAVEIEHSKQPITVTAKRVTVDVPQGHVVTAGNADAAAALTRANHLNGKPSFIGGSDHDKVMFYLASVKHGINVKNANDILALQAKKPEVWKAAQDSWNQYQASPTAQPAATANAAAAAPAANAMNKEEVRKTFTMPVGVIAEKLKLVDDKELARAAVQQADLVAIAQKLPAGDTTKLQFLKPDEIAAKKQSLGITDDDVKAARVIVDSGKGVPDSVPKFGMLLNVDRDSKNAVLMAQAAVRTLDIVDKIEQGKVPPATAEDVAKFPLNPMFSAIGKFPDPLPLFNAQTMNKAAAEYILKIGAGLEQDPKVVGYKAGALDTLKTAADEFRKKGHDQVASYLDEVRDSYKPATPAAAPGAKPTP